MFKFGYLLLLVIFIAILDVNFTEAKKKLRFKVNTVDVPNYGKVQGALKSTAWSERKYLRFRNIKYASATERFQPSVPYLPGNDTSENEVTTSSDEEKYDKEYIVNLYKSKNIHCPSLETLKDFEWMEGDDSKERNMEDCLFLTVSSRNVTSSQPVMVYLAGYDVVRKENDIREALPHYLLEKDIVLVAVQYRVGPFGFLSALNDEMPGNVGVLDVIEALRWIQKYINNFGGDPTRVTLFGQYHAAAIINALTMTPLCEKENLFTQVIYQSGSALLDDIATNEPLKCTKAIATHLNCENVEDPTALVKTLKSANIQDLLTAYKTYLDEVEDFPFLTVGGPSGLLTDMPCKLMESGSFRGYPTIGGSVKHPGVCEAMESMNSSIFRLEYGNELGLLKTLLEKIGSKNDDQIKYVDEKFPNKIFFNNIFKSVFPALIDLKGFNVKYATSKALKYNVEKGSPSYLYAFNYLGFFSRLDCAKEVLNDVSLVDDNMYLFPYPDRVENLTWKDMKMAKFMVDLWTSFATSGSPKAPGLHKWPVLEKESLGPYLGIDFIYKMGYDYSEEYFVTLKNQMTSENIYDHNH